MTDIDEELTRCFAAASPDVPADQLEQLRLLLGHLQPGLFITKFRKTFTRGEMNEDLEIVAARLGDHEDISEYEEMLPTSPP